MNVISILGGIFASPLAGDFEITEVLIAVSVFAFLPYCQYYGKNVTVDIFTRTVSPIKIALLQCVAAAIALVFAMLLGWRMWYGMWDMWAFGYTTAILQIPHGWAFIPILISLGLLCISCVASLIQHIQKIL